MLAFGLSLFPLTGIVGAGHFVRDGGIQSWCGWAQLATLLGQMVVFFLLRQKIIQQTDLIGADDVMCDAETLYLAVVAILLLFLGLGQYIYGIWRTHPTNS